MWPKNPDGLDSITEGVQEIVQEQEQENELAEAEYVIIDLHQGTVTTNDAMNQVDLTDSVYREHRLILRQVNAGSMLGGADPDHPWTLEDELPNEVSAATAFVGVFEITRAQWLALDGHASWEALPGDLVGEGRSLPAVGMAAETVIARLQSLSNTIGGEIRLPQSAEWEYWCRAGNSGLFHWGDDVAGSVPQQYAYTAETAPGLNAPQIVGSRDPNLNGLFDMHGNVWEMTTDSVIRGGSWRDGLPLARAGHASPMDEAIGHPLVGFRVVYLP